MVGLPHLAIHPHRPKEVELGLSAQVVLPLNSGCLLVVNAHLRPELTWLDFVSLHSEGLAGGPELEPENWPEAARPPTTPPVTSAALPMTMVAYSCSVKP
jgi:hypothetical protein